MKKMQMFYDYLCPFCKKGYEFLQEKIANYTDIEIEWRPVESHPLPEDFHPHTYLACQSFYAAVELGADIHAFHTAMYKAIVVDRQDVEKIDVICAIVKNIVDEKKFRDLLESGKYAKQVDENNDLAFEKSGVWYLPAFRMDDKKLDAEGGRGITPEQLEEFLRD
ncbi:MAG: DsbA family protein [Defluviitaleaceae bacterium]|nr:DsbA family protein [Defluviitaleaceae bacterium]